MYLLFDDSGKFHAGRVMADHDSSAQVELDSGKRVKVKAANQMLRFDKPAPAELLARAQAQAAEIDLDLAWECAPDEDFAFAELADDYFGDGAGPAEQAAALLALFDAPHYFRRLGKGRFRKAPQETVQAALAGIERKKQIAAQIEAWAAELVAGRCPAPLQEQLYKILFKPDKNGPEYKAVVEAARRSQRAPLDLLKDAGAIASPYQFHWRRFLFEQFPQGHGFAPAVQELVPPLPDELPRAAAQAFSIDDSATTEIDDALSVQGLGTGLVTLGIHIAAPALAIAPGSPLDEVARGRLSTVYLPGGKITMLPDAVVRAYTLAEGRDCPALSLYLTVDEHSLEVKEATTRVERVPIVANLRHDKLDAVVTEDALNAAAPAGFPFAPELAFCWRLAQAQKQRREAVRGKPELFARPDYSFRLVDAEGRAPQGDPTGEETVSIIPRRRGAPLDLIVAEAMILANSHWGGWLAQLGVPGIYRSQASLLPGIKVRMGVKPLPHAGIGVAQYAWSTSPLRRYVDLVNQWQIIACARHGHTAALAAPFRPKDAALFAVISAFDAAHAAYGDFQHGIERYWTLRHLQQQGTQEIDATVLKDGLVRADTLPLAFRLPGTEGLPRGTRVAARVTGIDLLTLELHAVLAARLEGADAGAVAADDDDGADDGDGGGALAGGGIALAIDLAEAGEVEGGAGAIADDGPAAAPSAPGAA